LRLLVALEVVLGRDAPYRFADDVERGLFAFLEAHAASPLPSSPMQPQ
jgi:hypothetical protein